MKVARRLGSQHRASECSKRLVGCRYCSKEFVAETLAVHHTKCGRFPLPCPNRCSSSEIAREELETHLKERCAGPAVQASANNSATTSPLTTLAVNSMVCCAFKEAGCRFKVCFVPHNFYITYLCYSYIKIEYIV
jgi:TNF receptor-associated factor 4